MNPTEPIKGKIIQISFVPLQAKGEGSTKFFIKRKHIPIEIEIEIIIVYFYSHHMKLTGLDF